MEQAIIDQTIKALERNHFEVYFANNRQDRLHRQVQD